jgi:hypothetical protein
VKKMLRMISGKDSEPRTPCLAGRQANSELSVSSSLDEALAEAQSSSLKKILFAGEKVNEIASYVAGWMAAQGGEVVVLDGANRFDPYTVSFFARKLFIPPEALLRKIRMARAFTCYQMSALMGEKLAAFLKAETTDKAVKPRVILLGPLTTFLDEDVSEREVSPLLERSLKKVDALAAEGVSFFLFQSHVPPRSKRAYLMKKLLQFSHVAWKISLDDEGPKVMMEKGPLENCELRLPTDRQACLPKGRDCELWIEKSKR